TPNALIQFIPVDDVLAELVIVFLVFIPISGIIGVLLGGYILSLIIMVLHKYFYRSKKFYGIQYESEDKKFSLLKSGFRDIF
ncbi:unnamed protein product, partial [marine sediment metagenome]